MGWGDSQMRVQDGGSGSGSGSGRVLSKTEIEKGS